MRRWDYKLKELNKDMKKVLSGLNWNGWRVAAHLTPLAPILEDKIFEDTDRTVTWAGPMSARHVDTSSAEDEMLKRLMAKRNLQPQAGRLGLTFLDEELLPACTSYLQDGAARVSDVVAQVQKTCTHKAPRVTVEHKCTAFTATEEAKLARRWKAPQAMAGLSTKAMLREIEARGVYFPGQSEGPDM